MIGRGALALALTVLTACPAPSEPSPSPTSSAPDTRALTIAYPFEPPTLDPYLPAAASPATTDVLGVLMPRLFGEPDDPLAVAASTEVIQGPPFTLQVTLQTDHAWSDGRPIAARDVVSTWRRARRSVGASAPYASIDAVVADGPTRVQIVFAERTSRWRELFSGPHGILPAHVADPTSWTVGGGGYVLERWRPGLDLRLRAVDGSAMFDPVRIVVVPEATGALELLRRGDVDALGPYHAPDFQRRAVEAGARIETVIGSWVGLSVRAGRAVRRALWAAIDIDRIARGLVQSEGEPIAWAHRRDPIAARQGLRGRTPDLVVAVEAFDDLGSIAARAVKFTAAEAGFEIEVVQLPSARFWSATPPDGFDAALVRVVGEPDRARLERDASVIPLYRRALTIASPDAPIVPWGGPEGVFARLAAA